MSELMRAIGLRIPQRLYERLQVIARQNGSNVTAVARELLAESLMQSRGDGKSAEGEREDPAAA